MENIKGFKYFNGGLYREVTRIDDTFKRLKMYYDVTRRCGHTTLMIEGIRNFGDCFLLGTTQDNARTIKENNNLKNCETVGVKSIRILDGNNIPLAIDNGAMYVILEDAILAIRLLSEENTKLRLLLDEKGNV